MGKFLNKGNEQFRRIRNDIYVDKTGLIEYINGTIATPGSLTCFTRPRRFGKSYTAKMLSAYYDKSCDSSQLFDDLAISRVGSYRKYLNSFNVIYIDVTWFIAKDRKMLDRVVTDIESCVISELQETFQGRVKDANSPLADAITDIYDKTGEQFFIIIDEWDALFREAMHNDELQRDYILFLRGLFQGGPAEDAIVGAFMTGILPIKKYGTGSSLTVFQEFTMLDAYELAPYVGFTEEDVRELCEKYKFDLEDMKCWYDGYSFNGEESIFCPNSVISAIKRKKLESFWTTSETYEPIKGYITMDLDGLKDAVISLLAGQRQSINVKRFQNDLNILLTRDAVLTVLVHLGYLAYDQSTQEVYIPNLEVADSFSHSHSGLCTHGHDHA